MTSSAVVGSSAMIRRGCAGQRHGDHDALAHAAGILVRIGAEPARRVGNAHPAQQLGRAWSSALAHGVPRCRLIGSATCMPTVSAGLSERHRLLEDHGDLVAADRADAGDRRASGDPAVEQDLAALDPARRVGISRRIDSAVTLLPEPDSPTMASVSPAIDVERDADRPPCTVPRSVRNRVVRLLTSSSGRVIAASALSSPSSSSAPDRPRCGHRSGPGAPRRRAARRRSSSPTATTP